MSTTPPLPGLDYSAPLGIADLEYAEQVYTDEITRRTRIGMGSYGIVASVDPVTASGASFPLYVSQNAQNALAVDVSTGQAVCPIGHVIIVPQVQVNTQPADVTPTNANAQNVVFIEYQLVGDEDTVVANRYNNAVAKDIVRPQSPGNTANNVATYKIIQTAKLADFNNVTLFPPDRMSQIVVLAVVTVNAAGTAISLIDLTRATYSYNRPWFSNIDITHRSFVGTGSTSTPHRIGLGDLSGGSMTLYQQLLEHGVVVGRPVSVTGAAGRICQETITEARKNIDTTGLVTGKVGTSYVMLTAYPTALAGCVGIVQSIDNTLVDLIPHTNILVIGDGESIPTGGCTVYYFNVDAAQPYVPASPTGELDFKQPIIGNESVITGGKPFDALTTTKVSFANVGTIARRYRVVLDDNANPVILPQVLVAPTPLESIGSNNVPVTSTMLGNGKLQVGLASAAHVAGLTVQVRLFGLDMNGLSTSEDVTFTFSPTTGVPYNPASAGSNIDDSGSYLPTNSVFSSLTSYQIITRQNDGAASLITIWAVIDPPTNFGLNDSCPLAEVWWNGQAIASISNPGVNYYYVYDLRPVVTTITNSDRNPSVVNAMLYSPSTIGNTILVEDIDNPKWLELELTTKFKLIEGLASRMGPLTGPQDTYATRAFKATSGTLSVDLFGIDLSTVLNLNYAQTPIVQYRYHDNNGWSAWANMTDSDPKHHTGATTLSTTKAQIMITGRVRAFRVAQ
jgi:hypothetical protein